MKLPLDSAPDSVCLLRLSAIGDVTHVVPVVRTLQHYWPACRLTWIIGKLEATLVGDLPGVEFIIFDKTTERKSLVQLRSALRGRHFDILLNMQVALRASLLSLCIPAHIRLGFDRRRAHDFQWLFTNARIDAAPRQHVLDGFFGFLQKLGLPERQLRWDIPLPDTARQVIDDLVPATRPVLVINPCSSARLRNWRNWPVERYVEVARHAADRHGLQVVLSGGPDALERETAAAICAGADAGDRIINLVGRTDLKQLLALLQCAVALIAPDTGPAHIATAAGTPVIGLFASSNPHRTGPYLSQDWLVDRYPDAALRYLGKPAEHLRWGQRIRHPDVMQLVTVDDVTGRLDRLMQSRPIQSRPTQSENS